MKFFICGKYIEISQVCLRNWFTGLASKENFYSIFQIDNIFVLNKLALYVFKLKEKILNTVCA